MNRKTLLVTFLFSISISSLFAADFDEVSKSIMENFQKEFNRAEDIHWTEAGELRKATFRLNGVEMHAYYTENGDKYASAKNVHVTEISEKVMLKIKNQFKNHWITSAFEVEQNGTKTFYVTFENADQKVMVKTNGKNAWTIYDRDSK